MFISTRSSVDASLHAHSHTSSASQNGHSSPSKLMKNDYTTFTFSEASLMGWAPDGGMLLPSSIPMVDKETILSWIDLSYADVVYNIMKLFVDEKELNHQHLKDIIHSSLHGCFDIDETLSTVPISSDDGKEIIVCELFHGPTQAFKDLSLLILVRVLQSLLSKRNERMCLLVGTSGDTGSAAISAVCDAMKEADEKEKNIDIVCLYPIGGRCSKVQELQMIQASKLNPDIVCLIGVDGSSDDLDVPIENIFKDVQYSRHHKINSVNSVNVVRLLVQIAHYFWTYLHVLKQKYGPSAIQSCQNAQISFVIPTGGGGNITAGIIAKLMGLPAHNIVAATNSNDALNILISGKALQPGKTKTVKTFSPAMDISVAYNLERILFLTSHDPILCRDFMHKLRSLDEPLQLPQNVLNKLKDIGVVSGSVSDDDIVKTISHFYEKNKYVVDPHTSVGIHVASRLDDDNENDHTPSTKIVLASASCAKFPVVCEKALNTHVQGISLHYPENILPSSNEGLSKMLEDPLRRAIIGSFLDHHKDFNTDFSKTNLYKILSTWDTSIDYTPLAAVFQTTESYKQWEDHLRQIIEKITTKRNHF